ncbi:MAG: TVP38/TMEM64 family protein [Betaproteobacteria bacterium]|nr:MAG: TVP38/TMEM64 family protein [Betaproteobacteria bacterium]
MFWGTLISTLASATGATIAMLATRFLFRDWMKARYATQMREVDRGIERNGAYYVFSLRVAPVIPYFILNWLVGLTTMRVWPFFWVSFVGMLPGTAVYVNAGNELSKVNSLSDVFSLPIALSFVALAVAPFLLKFIIEKFNAYKA